MRKKLNYVLGLGLGLALLIGCGSDAALSEVTLSEPIINLNTGPRTTTISYLIGQPTNVSIWLETTAGERYALRQAVKREPSKDAYQVVFDGSVPVDADTNRLLPNGNYTLVVEAENAAAQRLNLQIDQAPSASFDVYDLRVTPNPFSPDDDAVEDFTTFSYRLPITATVSLDVIDPTNQTRYPIVNRELQGLGEHSEAWSGRPVVGGILAAGQYQYELRADDGLGNRVTKRGDVTLSSAGIGALDVLSVEIGPEQILLNDTITVTFKVKNNSEVALRTFGPASGYTYSTNQSYSSIENEQYANLGGGLWRVAIDWDGNGGSGFRYPFRWAISPRSPEQWADPNKFDYLYPGEEATIIGRVQIKQREDRMTFYAGVAHEGVDYPTNRLKPTLILVSF
ncbi:hypothetical protein [Herpetosiphon sp. NSE202]|uniref:hypothetical protein n=1 Tax=Herpetosiphon sp. NSE202 TaxID=3351349 RepID=UPI00363FD6BB